MKPLKFYFEKASNTYGQSGYIQKKVAIHLLDMIAHDFYETVVEIGSGLGFVTIPLIKKISFNRYINIDISFRMLKKLKDSLKMSCFYLNAEAENLPIKPNSVNLLISSSTLHWLENRRSFLDILSLLREGAKFYFSIFVPNTLYEIKVASKLSGFGSLYNLKPSYSYLNLLDSIPSIKYKFYTKQFIEKYPTVTDLLYCLKRTGTNFTENKKFSGKNSFKRFCEVYEKHFGNEKGVKATYEVLFIEGQKISHAHQGLPLIP